MNLWGWHKPHKPHKLHAPSHRELTESHGESLGGMACQFQLARLAESEIGVQRSWGLGIILNISKPPRYDMI